MSLPHGFHKYRIFSNDRGIVNSVPMYSCLMQVNASDVADALTQAHPMYETPPLARLKAIKWPPTNDDDKAWIAKHVG